MLGTPQRPDNGFAMEKDARPSVARQAMLDFIHTAASMLGPRAAEFLEDLWLDELASMDSLPSPTSDEWRLISIAASARLASRLIKDQLGSLCL